MLSVSLLSRTPADDGRDERVAEGGTEGGSDGGNGVAMGLSSSSIEGATLESGDSPSSYLRAKKLLSSPSASPSEPGELASVSFVFRFVRPARERLWRTSVTGVIALADCGGWGTPREVDSRGERGGDERAIDFADAVSPSEKWWSEKSSSWSGSTRKREWSGEGCGESLNADAMERDGIDGEWPGV